MLDDASTVRFVAMWSCVEWEAIRVKSRPRGTRVEEESVPSRCSMNVYERCHHTQGAPAFRHLATGSPHESRREGIMDVEMPRIKWTITDEAPMLVR